MLNVLIQSLIILVWIILLTIFQRYHYKMLDYLAHKYHSIFKWIIKFIRRFWIIIHELWHLFFWVLSGAKIQKVELFRDDWWRVVFATKDYIWHLPKYSWHSWYLFKLFFNQIWIFLTSIWPLIFWIISTFLIVNYFDIPLNFNEFKSYILNHKFDYKTIWITIIYIIFIPSFLLSIIDIKNFIISRQDWYFATIFWSFINTFIFICFLAFLTFFFDFFLFFFIIYLWLFTTLFIFWLVNFIIIKTFSK